MFLRVFIYLLVNASLFAATHIAPVTSHVTEAERVTQTGHEGKILWFTGLSGSGKSTLAIQLERELFNRGRFVKLIDGDNLRSDLCSDLQFSPNARTENIRRAGAVCELFRQSGFIVIASFISPIRADREKLKERFGNKFVEIYVKASIEECVKRDPKGFYKKALEGKIQDYTGLQQSYEVPENSDLVIDTELLSMEECLRILSKLTFE